MKYKLLLLIACIPSLWLFLQARDVPLLGLYGDDTIYYSSAKAVYEGKGYRIPNLEGEPYQTKYPPLFPLILSIAWWLDPVFPRNLAIAAWLAWMAVPLYLWLAWRVFRKLGFAEPTALVLVFILALNGQVLAFGTMLMSEIWFSCAVLAVIAVAPEKPWLAGVLAGLAFLIKTGAIPFLVILPVCIVFAKRYKDAGRAALPIAAAVAGWFTWARLHATPSTDISILYNTSYLGYYLSGLTTETFFRIAATNARLLYWGLPRLIPLDPSSSTLEATLSIFVLAAGGAGVVLLMARRGGVSELRLLYPLFALAYLTQLVVWNFAPTPRLLLPVLPLMLAGVAKAVATSVDVMNSGLPVLRPKAILALTTLGLMGPLGFYWAILSFGVLAINLPATFRENRAALAAKREAYEWILKNTPREAAVLANDDQLLYLYTGRRSASQIIPATLYYQGNDDASLRAELEKLPTYARERNLDYVLVTSTDLRRENLEKYRPELERIMNSPASRYGKVFDRPQAKIYATASQR